MQASAARAAEIASLERGAPSSSAAA